MKIHLHRWLWLAGACLGCLPANAYNFQVDGIYYDRVGDNRLLVTGSHSGSHFYFGDVVIPSSVTYGGSIYSVTGIRSEAFRHCTGLTSVTIPESVTEIGSYAFEGCIDLQSIVVAENNSSYASLEGVLFNKDKTTLIQCPRKKAGAYMIPSSVINIGEYTFQGCWGLTSITIPKSVTNIGDAAFSGCTGLTSVTIPESVTEIGSRAFSGCSGLISITIPESVTNIGSRAFLGCTSLTSVTIPELVTEIGSYAFSGCTSLTSVTIPRSNASIEASTPSDSKNLIQGKLSSGVASIGDHAFYNCINLTTIDLPAGLATIGNEAFKFCYLPSIALPDGVTKIGDGAFYCCNFAKIKIPDQVTAIGTETFYGCSKLAYVDIPEGVTSIGKSAFEKCAVLSSITLPVSLSHIGENVFAGCTDLSEIISKNPIPPSAESSTFDEMHYTESTLRVPIVSFSRYKVAEVWSNFVDMQETNVTRYTVEAVSADESAGSVIGGGTYDEGKTITLAAIPTSGYYFVQWSDGNTENPRQVTVTGDMTFVAEFESAGSAIETLENGERLIYTVDNTLHVGNNGEMYRIYTSTGQLVYTGNEAAVSLENSGIYIVCIGERSQKVIVK